MLKSFVSNLFAKWVSGMGAQENEKEKQSTIVFNPGTNGSKLQFKVMVVGKVLSLLL